MFVGSFGGGVQREVPDLSRLEIKFAWAINDYRTYGSAILCSLRAAHTSWKNGIFIREEILVKSSETSI